MYSIYIEIIQMIYKNDPLNKSSKNCFLFTTLDLKNDGLVAFPLIVSFSFGMLTTLAILEKNSKAGIFVIGAT